MIQKSIIQTISDSSQHELLTVSGTRIVLRDNTVYSFQVHVNVKAVDSSDSSVFEIMGAIRRGVGVATVAFINADPIQVIPAQESGITRTISFLADTVNGALGIFGTGAGVWMVTVELYPNPEYVEVSTGYQAYLDEIASLIQDEAAKLSVIDVALLLKKAVTDWGRDVPLKVAKKITGTGSNKYLLSTILTGLWKHGYSQIFGIEYPYGLEPPSLLIDEDWQIYDDGTAQDGSNLQLWLIENNPSTSDFFVLAFTVEPYIQVGLQNFPDTNANFSQITTLAAAYACQRLATAYAQSTDASISADVVNYNDKAAKYTTLAKQYFNRYNILVYGQEEPKSSIKAAMSQKELTPTTNQDNMSSLTGGVISSSYLFHRVRRH